MIVKIEELERCIGSTEEELDITNICTCKDCKRLLLCSGVGFTSTTYHLCESCVGKEETEDILP